MSTVCSNVVCDREGLPRAELRWDTGKAYKLPADWGKVMEPSGGCSFRVISGLACDVIVLLFVTGPTLRALFTVIEANDGVGSVETLVTGGAGTGAVGGTGTGA